MVAPLVCPLKQGFKETCIARPDEGGRRFLLQEHLEAVAADCGSPNGAPEERLAFLAGLLHDAAKANADWQEYIRGHRPKGPPHSPLGAALFAFCADRLIPAWTGDKAERERLRDLALDWTRAVYDHHGKLDDLDTLPPWEASFSGLELQELLDRCDTSSLFGLVAKHFSGLEANGKQFREWAESFANIWERRFRFGRERLLRQGSRTQPENTDHSEQALRLPQAASRLIRADRYHAGGFEHATLSSINADLAASHLEAQCRERAAQALKSGADASLVECRGQVQGVALDTYRRHTDATFFTLLLPTGYGKTLTGLRAALEACRSGRCERVVYVAPYLSILSQAAREMSDATGLEVFQHHHLTLAELADDEDVEVLDTWQAPVLATTFNQFFRALFPYRAQECLRIEALRRAFIIVDEPQIVDTSVWNLFLRGLAVASREWNCQVLFATATLPLLEEGLGTAPVPLASPVTPPGRFTLAYDGHPLMAAEVADRVCQIEARGNSVAVVLNTVRDAAQIYLLLNNRMENTALYCLTAMMLPNHKAATIQAIREQLARNNPVVAVCTQILEAGIDLSFRRVLRALPIFPSIAQVAGRANRHGEGTRATVTVFPFVRDGGEDTRRYVYRDETARRQTDALLSDHPNLGEEEVGAVLQTYFQRCWDENRHMACLEKLEQAARGVWSALAGLEPFGGDALREEVFVPTANMALTPAMQRLLTEFAPQGPEQLLSRYRDPSFRRRLTFLDRKRFLALLRQYIVPVPRKVAEQVADPVTDWLWRLSNLDDYSPATGLAHLLGSEPGPDVLIL